jgi:hypothetical protein
VTRSGEIAEDVQRKPSLQVVLPAPRPLLPGTTPVR